MNYIEASITYIDSEMSIEKTEVRKIQLVGGSTYIASLPKEWVERNGLSRGSPIHMVVRRDEIVIRPRPRREASRRSVIRLPGDTDIKMLERIVLSHYLAGSDVIYVYLGERQEYRMAIRRLIKKKMIGFEVFDEGMDYIELRSFIREGDIDLGMALDRMFKIARINMGTVPDMVRRLDRAIARTVTENDDDMDRFYLYSIRLIRRGESGRVGELVTEAMISKTLERIMDHIARIAYTVLAYEGEKSETLEELSSLAYMAGEILSYSEHSYRTMDIEKANETISAGKRLIARIEATAKKLQSKPPRSPILASTILESIKRITEYTMDLGEMTIDLYTASSIPREEQ